MAKKTTGWKVLNSERFDRIIQLLDYGLKQSQVAEIVGCAAPTISRVHTSGARTFEEWGAHLKKERERRLARKQDDKASEPTKVEATPTVEATKGKTYFSEDSANLERIASALERLADAWEQSPTKRKGFF